MTNMHPGSDGTYSLRDFIAQTAERDNPGEVFELESSKMLEVKVNGRIWSKLGAMVAYKGNLSFTREGMLEGGLMKALKRAVSQEMSPWRRSRGAAWRTSPIRARRCRSCACRATR